MQTWSVPVSPVSPEVQQRVVVFLGRPRGERARDVRRTLCEELADGDAAATIGHDVKLAAAVYYGTAVFGAE